MAISSETTTSQRDVLSWLAEGGEYYGSVNEIPDDILASKTKAIERIIAAPDQFPHADHARLEEVWPAFVAVCAGRLIFLD